MITRKGIVDYVMNTPENTNPSVLDSLIASLESSDDIALEEITINENKVQTAPSGSAYSKVTVSVPETQLDSLTVSENGVTNAEAGHAFNKVTVNVPIKTEIELSATENKVYTPEAGKSYSKVTVNVPAPVSDYTTATVTVVVQEGGGLDNNYLSLPVIESDNINSTVIYGGGTYTVPLYKGVAKGWSYKGVDSVSGDCTESNHDLTITGNCIITFTP